MKAEPADKKFGLHPDVLKLGLVSFLTDLSSEMIFSVFAIFFTTIAGASAALLGMIEGLADLSASSLNYLAGWLSDRTGKRKVFALAGYGFSALAKIILLITSSVVGLSIFRVIERLGKGFRGPPRDAWLSAVSDKDTRGIFVRSAQGSRQIWSRSWPTCGVRPAFVAWGRRLDVPDPILGRARSCLARHRGLKSHQGSARGSAPTREHVRNMENSQPGIQALSRRSRNFFAGLFQFRLSTVACTQRRIFSQGHRVALCLVQYCVRCCITADRQTWRSFWKGADNYAGLSDLFVDKPRFRIRDHTMAGHCPVYHLWRVLCDRRSPKQGVYSRHRIGAARVCDRCLQFCDRPYLSACIADSWGIVVDASVERFLFGCMSRLYRTDGIRILAARPKNLFVVVK